MRFLGILLIVFIPACSPPRTGQETAPQPPKFASPHGYTRETANRKFTFVMLAPAGADLNALPHSYQSQSEELAKKYRTSGLYRTGETAPEWTYGGPYSFEVFPANDGIHLAVLEGESWFTSQFVSGQKLPAEEETKQLDSAAVTFYRIGEKLKSHSVREVVGDAKRLRHSPQHVQWRAGEAIVEKTGRFVIYSQDAQKIVFDMSTGEIRSKESAGTDAKYFLAAVGAITVVAVLLAIRWLVRDPKVDRNSVATLAEPPFAP